MKTLETSFKNINVNIEAIAEVVKEFHHENEEKRTLLAFGMLNAKIMDTTEKELKKKLESQFDEFELIITKYDIDPFVKDCMQFVTNYVYKNSKMIV